MRSLHPCPCRTTANDCLRRTKDAAKDVNLGILDGPILRVECDPVDDGSTDDLIAHTGKFSCLAVTKIHHASGNESGYEFSSLMNWGTERYLAPRERLSAAGRVGAGRTAPTGTSARRVRPWQQLPTLFSGGE
jgi:hypothetical protein